MEKKAISPIKLHREEIVIRTKEDILKLCAGLRRILTETNTTSIRIIAEHFNPNPLSKKDSD